MPLYICNHAPGAVDPTQRAEIAREVTRIHCEVTGAPPAFVHVFFFEDAPQWPRGDAQALLGATIRRGRTDEQKSRMADAMQQSLGALAGLRPETVRVAIRDTPASWVMEGGEVMPEPGEEAEWFAAQASRQQVPA